MPDILDEAQARFRALRSYRVTLRSETVEDGRLLMNYGYCRPGWVRIDCIEPHDGAVLIYDPEARRARLWLFGPRMGALTFAPDNPLLEGPGGHRIDRSDVGALLDALQTMRGRGRLSLLGAADVAGRPTTAIEVVDSGALRGDPPCHRVWFASDTLFPLRVESFDARGDTVETVEMIDAALDVDFPDRFFRP